MFEWKMEPGCPTPWGGISEPVTNYVLKLMLST